jgi:uncharacterized protein YggT (Ycf19 family)
MSTVLAAAALAIQLYLVVVVVDVVLAWLQPPGSMPRRLTHALTEPPQAVLRAVLRPAWTGGWDVSPAVVVVALGAVRVWLVQP